jgi:transposase-like protein
VPGTTPRYPPEFKSEAVRLVRSSEKPVPQLAKELEAVMNLLRSGLLMRKTGDRKGTELPE